MRKQSIPSIHKENRSPKRSSVASPLIKQGIHHSPSRTKKTSPPSDSKAKAFKFDERAESFLPKVILQVNWDDVENIKAVHREYFMPPDRFTVHELLQCEEIDGMLGLQSLRLFPINTPLDQLHVDFLSYMTRDQYEWVQSAKHLAINPETDDQELTSHFRSGLAISISAQVMLPIMARALDEAGVRNFPNLDQCLITACIQDQIEDYIVRIQTARKGQENARLLKRPLNDNSRGVFGLRNEYIQGGADHE